MNKVLTYLFVAALAALVSYGGAGVNFISYCCDDCRAEGVEVLTGDKCHDIHHEVHCEEHCCGHGVTLAEADNGMHFCETDCCSMERVSFEWNQAVQPVFQLEPPVVDLFAEAVSAALLTLTPVPAEAVQAVPDDPPNILCPRAYLSLLTTLLI